MTLWVSHRGVCTDHDENTAGAFDVAVRNGFRHIETDLRMTLDGRIIHWHDESVRDLHGNSYRIDQTSSSKLTSLVLPKGGRLMLFDEFSSRYSNVGWTLDIKRETGAEVLKMFKDDMASQANLRRSNDVRFLLWNAAHIAYASQELPQFQRYASKRECICAGLAALTGIGTSWLIDSRLIYAVTPSFAGIKMFQVRYVDRYHQRGARIIAYLPTTNDELNDAIRLGIAEILVDFPNPAVGG